MEIKKTKSNKKWINPGSSVFLIFTAQPVGGFVYPTTQVGYPVAHAYPPAVGAAPPYQPPAPGAAPPYSPPQGPIDNPAYTSGPGYGTKNASAPPATNMGGWVAFMAYIFKSI